MTLEYFSPYILIVDTIVDHCKKKMLDGNNGLTNSSFASIQD